jgi:hypothetical protein
MQSKTNESRAECWVGTDAPDPRVLASTLDPIALRRAKQRLADHFRRWEALWAQYELESERAWEARTREQKRVTWPVRPTPPPFPDGIRALPCGARTRAGTPCKRIDIYANGRCKLHGGLSTGPRTREGMRRARRNLTQFRTP